jgi:molecular chaperone GrpE
MKIMSDKKNKSKENSKENFNKEYEEQAGEVTEPVVVDKSPEAEVEALKAQVVEAQAKVQEYLDAWQRERASFMNFRRRTEQENAQVVQFASGNTIKKFLSGIDDLERALAHHPAEDVWAEGIELVYRKFLSILEAEGITRIQAEGQPFNPELHEAIMQEPSDKYPSGVVIAVLQQGYMHGERVLRPAMVKVAQ